MLWTDGLSVFTKLRIQITAVTTALVFAVLVVTFASIIWSEYSSKMLIVSECLTEAVANNEDLLYEGTGVVEDAQASFDDDALLEQGGEGDDGSVSEAPSVSSSTKLGANSEFKATTYVPIIIYRIDYEHHVLILVASDNTTLTDESFEKANTTLIDMDYGFARDDESMLYYLKEKTDYGDVMAFTDVSVVDSYISTLSRAFLIVIVLVTIMIGAIVWLLTSWIVKPVREAWAKQKQFVADASHELKTPISVIMANSAIILDSAPGQDDGNVRKWTKSTQEEAENLNALVADMLYLATNDTEKRVVATTFNFSKMVQKTAMQFEARAFEKDNLLVYDDVASGIEVNGEEMGISRVVAILLDNACKYSHPNTVITVTLWEDRKNAVLSVADDGDEIPEDMLDSIFDRFFRVDQSRTGENGYGLGLAMARDIVERHGGTIAATSKAGHTVFTVKLPKNVR